MNLQTRRPPGHAKRKALTYTADIVGLRIQGHTYSAIREQNAHSSGPLRSPHKS
jgi:hypothetical protein